jgi:mediator of RNA polymerase II transcription subunit 19
MMDGYSPKSSPQRGNFPAAAGGGGMPNNAAAAADQAGSLKMKLQIHPKQFPFYLMRPDNISLSEVTGATNLMASKNLEAAYAKLASKKMKDSLSSFLPQLPGVVDTPGSADNSSLRGLIDKPPVGGKELVPLNQLQLAGFRLHPGPLPEQYRSLLNQVRCSNAALILFRKKQICFISRLYKL